MGGTLNFPEPPSAVIPVQPFSCLSALSPSLCGLLHGTEEEERERGGERKSGQREEARGRKWAAAPTWATAAMEPCGLVCFTLTVGSRLVGHVTASPFSCLASEEFERGFVQTVGSPVPGPFPGSLSQTAFLSVSTCPPVELKMFLISCGGFPPSPFFLFSHFHE